MSPPWLTNLILIKLLEAIAWSRYNSIKCAFYGWRNRRTKKLSNLSKVTQLVSGRAMIQYKEGCSWEDVLLNLPWFRCFEWTVVPCFPNYDTDSSQEMTIYVLKWSYITNNESSFKRLNLKYIYRFCFVLFWEGVQNAFRDS